MYTTALTCTLQHTSTSDTTKVMNGNVQMITQSFQILSGQSGDNDGHGVTVVVREVTVVVREVTVAVGKVIVVTRLTAICSQVQL